MAIAMPESRPPTGGLPHFTGVSVNTGRSLAKTIQVTQRRGFSENIHSVLIDGEEFPWFISTKGIATTVTEGELPSITLTIPAESLTVIDEWPA